MMNMSAKKLNKCRKWSYLLLRVGFGLFFFFSGLPKLVMLFSGANPLQPFGIAIWLSWIVALIEVVGGVFLTLGLWRYWSGHLIAVVMIVALVYRFIGGLDGSVSSLLGTLFQHVLYIGAALWLSTTKEDFCAIQKNTMK